MLKLIPMSQAKKTAGCAVTYRAGRGSCFGTCPQSCQLNPEVDASTVKVDMPYFKALCAAIPPKGYSFVYTHFDPDLWYPYYRGRLNRKRKTTTVNYSADTLEQAHKAFKRKLSVVVALPKALACRVLDCQGIRVVRCPAEYLPVTCRDCGGSEGPLCARKRRNYIIGFYGHGPGARYVGTDAQAGCYASMGNVRLNWEKVIGVPGDEPDVIREFAKDLPRGTVLRHHVAGDIGLDRGLGSG